MRFGGRKEKLKTIATDRTQSVSCVHPLESTKPMSWLEVQDWDKNLDAYVRQAPLVVRQLRIVPGDFAVSWKVREVRRLRDTVKDVATLLE